MRKGTSCLLLLLLSITVGGFSQAQEQPTADRLDGLQKQLQEQQQQIESLKKAQATLLEELQALRAQSAQPATAATTEVERPTTEPAMATQAGGEPAAPSATGVQASRYVDWRGQGIALGDRVRIGGYGSVRFETNDLPSGNNIPGGSAGGFTFRRFVVTTDARVAPRLRVYSEIEFERLFGIEVEKSGTFEPGKLELEQETEGRGELAIEQAWGQYNFAENHGLRAGVVLAPVGRFNLLHDDDYWDVPRRTLTDRDAPVLPVKSAWRDLGAGLVGGFHAGATGELDYQVYVLNGAALDFNFEQEIETEAGVPGEAVLALKGELGLTSGFFDGTRSATALAWRAAYSPSLHGEMAISGYHGKYAPSFLSFREPVTSLAYDHKWRWKGFETEAEFVYTSMGRLDRVLDAFALAAFNSANQTLATSGSGGLTKTEVELELANLSRTRLGFWTDFKYHARPKWLKKTFLGRPFEDPQIIPILRYERVWLNRATSDIEVVGGAVTSKSQQDLEQDRFTLGVSYRPNLQFALQAAYEHNRRINGDRLIFPAVDEDSTSGLILGMSFAF